MAWRDRFRATANDLDPVQYDTRFKRMWEFYLGCCINAFEEEPYGYGMQVGQFVFVK
jgi:cyclopropane-fatty-acyl-phospholipid synthase